MSIIKSLRSLLSKVSPPTDPEELAMFRLGEEHERADAPAPAIEDPRLAKAYSRGRSFAEFTHF